MTSSLPHAREPRTTPATAQDLPSLHTLAGDIPHADGIPLSIALRLLGYTHTEAAHGSRHIKRSGVVVFTGAWDAVWCWLTLRGEIRWQTRPACVDDQRLIEIAGRAMAGAS